MRVLGDREHCVTLSPSFAAEDHGDEFYLIWRGQGYDATVSLDAQVAEALARFILSRRAAEPHSREKPS